MNDRAPCSGCGKPVVMPRYSSIIRQEPCVAFPELLQPVPYLFCDECYLAGKASKIKGTCFMSEAAYKYEEAK